MAAGLKVLYFSAETGLAGWCCLVLLVFRVERLLDAALAQPCGFKV